MRTVSSRGVGIGGGRLLLGLGAGLLGLGVLAAAGPAHAENAPECVTPLVWVNSGDYGTPGGLLRAYEIDPVTGAIGAVAQEVALDRSFGDIAITSDGSTLYGVDFASAPALYTIDPSDGSATELGPIQDSDGVVVGTLNSLTVTPDGDLYVGSSQWMNVWRLDPAARVLQLPFFATYPRDAADFELASAGDILTLGDGSVLALAIALNEPGTPTYLLRLAPGSSTPVIVGAVPISFGMAQSNGWVYLAQADGHLAYLAAADVPTTPSEDPIPLAGSIATGIDLWGATATGDVALGCPPDPEPTPGPELAATGWDAAGPLLAAAGLLLVGASLRLRRRRAG